MVRPEKWADFTMLGAVSKQRGGQTILYARFQCPYGCGDTVDLPEANVKNNKSNRCHDHLMTCTGATADGKLAEDDPRVCNERKAAARCSTHMRAAKRGRTGEMMTAVETTLALRQEVTALQASKDELASRNDGLQGRVLDLETQMEEMRVRDRQRVERDRQRDLEMQELRAEMQQLRPLVPLVQRITSELGLNASVPPAAPIDTYVDKIDGLRKAAALAHAPHAPHADKRIAKLKREIETLQHQNQRLRKAGIEGRKYSDYWRLANPLFDDPKHSVVFLRKAMIFVHPDKQPTHKAPAHALQQILNHLVNELRAA